MEDRLKRIEAQVMDLRLARLEENLLNYRVTGGTPGLGGGSAAASVTPKGSRVVAGDESGSNVKYHYWGGVKARNHYTQFMLAGTGTAHKVDLVSDYPYPGTAEWEALPTDKHVLSSWNQLPFLTDEAESVCVGESMGIHRYLIAKFGLQPQSLSDVALSEQAIELCAGLHNALSKAHYAPDRTFAMDAFFAKGGSKDKLLSGLESSSFKGGGVWLGSEPSPGDWSVGAALDILNQLEPGCFDRYSKLKALHDEIQGTAAVKAYLKTVPYAYFKRNTDA